MIRRSFRVGLWLGLLSGAAYALLRLIQSRGQASPVAATSTPAQPWPRLVVDEEPAPTRETWKAPVAAEPASPAPAPESRDAWTTPATDAVVTVEEPPAAEPAVEAQVAAAVQPPAVEEPPVEAPAPAPAAKAVAKKAAAKKVLAPWVDPKGGVCPKAHPVKAKLSSRIYQVPGNFAYDRTNPDRCYGDAATAEADGFRAAKR